MNTVQVNRRWWKAGAVIAAAVATLVPLFTAPAQPANPPPAPRRASIILILAQSAGCDDLACYGQTKSKTPNLDKLAGEGVRFTSFYAGSAESAPSRAALMLGQHTGHLRIRGSAPDATLESNEVTVADVLKRSGYHTGIIGLWGLASANAPGVPQKMGFDEWVGYLDEVEARDPYPASLWRFDAKSGFEGKVRLVQNENGSQGESAGDIFTRAALKFVQNNQPDPFNRYQPFFLFLAWPAPRANGEAAGAIARLDANIGRLLDKLQELKIDGNTAVFFSSDKGSLRGSNRDLAEGAIRVPMIVRWPAKIQPGQVSDFVWANWDFLPTAAEIAYGKLPGDIDGLSVLPLLASRPSPNRHEFLYWESHEHGFQQAVRLGGWKAVRPQAGEPLELYDLKTDSVERQNVAGKHPDVVARIEDYLKTARVESARWPIQNPTQAGKGNKP